MKKLVFAALLALAGCGKSSDPTATASTDAVPASSHSAVAPTVRSAAPTDAPSPLASASLSDRLACLRKSDGVVVIGHRGGPTRDFPANALESLQRTYKAGTHGMEIDAAQTRD